MKPREIIADNMEAIAQMSMLPIKDVLSVTEKLNNEKPYAQDLVEALKINLHTAENYFKIPTNRDLNLEALFILACQCAEGMFPGRITQEHVPQ